METRGVEAEARILEILLLIRNCWLRREDISGWWRGGGGWICIFFLIFREGSAQPGLYFIYLFVYLFIYLFIFREGGGGGLEFISSLITLFV